MQLVFLAAHHHSMAGIVSALEAYHHIIILRQQIDYLALSFITKLRTGEYRKHALLVSDHVDNNFDRHARLWPPWHPGPMPGRCL